jgi:hypothetical protein
MLRADQEAAAIRAGADPTTRPASQLDATLSALHWRKVFRRGRDDESVRRGAATFDRRTEAQRIGLPEELIRRVEPGPFEDPIYMALLAYQAASVEMVIRRPGTPKEGEWPTFLLGPLPPVT